MKIKTEVTHRSVEGLESRVRDFEVRYGVPSARLGELMARGESDDLRQWSLLHQTLETVRACAARR